MWTLPVVIEVKKEVAQQSNLLDRLPVEIGTEITTLVEMTGETPTREMIKAIVIEKEIAEIPRTVTGVTGSAVTHAVGADVTKRKLKGGVVTREEHLIMRRAKLTRAAVIYILAVAVVHLKSIKTEQRILKLRKGTGCTKNAENKER